MPDTFRAPANELEPDLDRKRRLARRRMAAISFGLLVIQSAGLHGSLLLSSERQGIATAFQTAWSVMAGTNLVLVSIVLAYLGVSLTERLWPK